MLTTKSARYLHNQLAQEMERRGPYDPELRREVKRVIEAASDRDLATQLDGIAYVLDVDYGSGDDHYELTAEEKRLQSLAGMVIVQGIAERLRQLSPV